MCVAVRSGRGANAVQGARILTGGAALLRAYVAVALTSLAG